MNIAEQLRQASPYTIPEFRSAWNEVCNKLEERLKDIKIPQWLKATERLPEVPEGKWKPFNAIYEGEPCVMVVFKGAIKLVFGDHSKKDQLVTFQELYYLDESSSPPCC